MGLRWSGHQGLAKAILTGRKESVGRKAKGREDE